jgi:hypothetical protein
MKPPSCATSALSENVAHWDATIQNYSEIVLLREQVIRQYPLMGTPQRRGHACMPPGASRVSECVPMKITRNKCEFRIFFTLSPVCDERRRPVGAPPRRHQLPDFLETVALPCPARGPEAGSTHINSQYVTGFHRSGVNGTESCRFLQSRENNNPYSCKREMNTGERRGYGLAGVSPAAGGCTRYPGYPCNPLRTRAP